MKRINLILIVFALVVLAACGARKDRCPSVGAVQSTSTAIAV